MKSIKHTVIAMLASAALMTAAPTQRIENDIISNEWIVIMRDNVPDSVFTRFKQHFRKRSKYGSVRINHEYDMGSDSFRGFALAGPRDAILAINESEYISNIEPDRWFYTQDIDQDLSARNATSGALGTYKLNASWNLDKISHLGPTGSRPRPGQYLCPGSCGNGTYAYVIDSGVKIQHPAFDGRAEHGWTPCENGAEDESGHGTHVAGTVAGAYNGVATQASVVSVKVFCDGDDLTSISTILAGIDWAVKDIESKGRIGKAVINLSLGGRRMGEQDALMWATATAVSKGIFVAVAAGNIASDARGLSPAAEPSVCTVGAIDKELNFWSFSNHGPAVDILAPGSDIPSVDFKNDIKPTLKTGTSCAAPHVAGVALTLMAAGDAGRLNQLCGKLKHMGGILKANIPRNTTDKVLWNGMRE